MEHKTVFITGGAKGIGKAIALQFAKAGYQLVINYRDEQAKNALQEALQAYNVKTLFLSGDVSSEADVKEMFDQAVKTFDRIDVLVNNAGITRDQLAMRMKAADFQQVLDVNLTGAFYFMQQAARHMLKKKSGRIISISSIVGLHGNVGQINYAASKAGLIAMTKTLALELASRKITVNAVAPGFIDSDMTEQLSDEIKEQMLAKIPLGYYGSPKDVAEVVAFLASDAAQYITGQVISVDGGMNI